MTFSGSLTRHLRLSRRRRLTQRLRRVVPKEFNRLRGHSLQALTVEHTDVQRILEDSGRIRALHLRGGVLLHLLFGRNLRTTEETCARHSDTAHETNLQRSLSY